MPPLSIDVDIITQAKPEDLAATLEAVAKLAPRTSLPRLKSWFTRAFLRLVRLIES